MRVRRSLYVRILGASFATLAISGLAFVGVFLAVSRPGFERMFQRYQGVQADDAVRTWEQSGAAALRNYLDRLDTVFEAKYYLTDANGRDVLDGTNRSSLLGPEPTDKPHTLRSGLLAVARPSSDRRFRLIFVAPPPFGIGDVLAYYMLILGAVAVLCWWLAVSIATPLRDLAGVVDRFGRRSFEGTSRHARRADELGDLARSFAQMAQRIDTLLTAERRLLTDISHELRSPLARLSMAVELFRTAPDRDGAADRAQKEVDRLSTLLTSLVEITRAEGDPGAAPAAESIDISALLGEVVDAYVAEARARSLQLVLAHDGVASISGRRELLRSAFENVIRNAIRYAPTSSRIEIGVTNRGHAVVVSVRDFGPGVSTADLPRLATPFFRSEPARDTKTGGVGLGLALARRAVLVHHGTFAAENADPGLRISLRFPTRA